MLQQQRVSNPVIKQEDQIIQEDQVWVERFETAIAKGKRKNDWTELCALMWSAEVFSPVSRQDEVTPGNTDAVFALLISAIRSDEFAALSGSRQVIFTLLTNWIDPDPQRKKMLLDALSFAFCHARYAELQSEIADLIGRRYSDEKASSKISPLPTIQRFLELPTPEARWAVRDALMPLALYSSDEELRTQALALLEQMRFDAAPEVREAAENAIHVILSVKSPDKATLCL